MELSCFMTQRFYVNLGLSYRSRIQIEFECRYDNRPLLEKQTK